MCRGGLGGGGSVAAANNLQSAGRVERIFSKASGK